MVGGEHDDDCVGRAARGEARRDGDRRTRVAARRLQHDVGLRADLAQLVGDEEAVVEIGDDDRPFERRVGQHRHRRLEGGALANERNELLGKRLAQLGPHPRPRSAAHNNGQYLLHKPL